MAQYSFNSHHYADLWARRTDAVTPQVRAAIRVLGRTMLQTSLGYMNLMIYRIPEDRSSTGRPLWRRTGQLVHKERLVYDADGAGVSLINETPYAEVRHEMGKPGRRPTRRFAPWRDATMQAIMKVAPGLLQSVMPALWQGNAVGGISALGAGTAATEGGSGGAARARGQATRGANRPGPTGEAVQAGGGEGREPAQRRRPARRRRLFPPRRIRARRLRRA